MWSHAIYVCQHRLSEFQVSVVIMPYCNELLLGDLVNNWSKLILVQVYCKLSTESSNFTD